jgi:hypothetical protein
MVRRLPAVLHHKIMPFVNRWQMVSYHPGRSLSSFVKLQGRELRRGWKGRAGILFGDIGGFGVGSHFTYSVLGLLGYRFQMFGRAAIAHAGYRALSQNYATRTDGDLFKWDMILHGPILGLTIRF